MYQMFRFFPCFFTSVKIKAIPTFRGNYSSFPPSRHIHRKCLNKRNIWNKWNIPYISYTYTSPHFGTSRNMRNIRLLSTINYDYRLV